MNQITRITASRSMTCPRDRLGILFLIIYVLDDMIGPGWILDASKAQVSIPKEYVGKAALGGWLVDLE